MSTYFLYFFLSVVLATQTILGVAPDLLPKYETLANNSTKWACLNDSSIVLELNQINDGICDCPDGSDEPGTNACAQPSLFYCANEGFAPKYILNHKINDGICDCCDCSDEYLYPIFSQSLSCEELNHDFSEMVAQELSTYEKGLAVLNKLRNKKIARDIGYDKGNELRQAISIEEDYVTRLREKIEISTIDLLRVEETYHEKLKMEAPELYHYEKLNISMLSSRIHDAFSSVELLSTAFVELKSILDILEQSRNHELKDAAVITNIQKFNRMKKEHITSFTPNSNLDQTQRNQIVSFLNEELPAWFFSDKHTYSASVLVEKLKVAQNIVEAKMKIKEFTLVSIPQLRSMMEDIIRNHDVNYQDPAVKTATESFMAFSTKYEALDYIDSTTDEFWANISDHISEVVKFVEKQAPSLKQGKYEGNFINRMFSLSSILSFSSNSFDSFRSQIKNFRTRIELLESQLSDSLSKLEQLRSELGKYAESSVTQARKNAQVKELLESLDEFCVSSQLDQFVYHLCFSKTQGRIVQTEDKPGGASVLIGMFSGFRIDETSKWDYYLQVLRLRYPDSEVPMQLTSDTLEIGHQKTSIGNLPDMNSGIKLLYNSGDKCWNGPRRSAELSVSCAPEFKIEAVSEPSKCSYEIELKSPLGCDPDFIFHRPDWFVN